MEKPKITITTQEPYPHLHTTFGISDERMLELAKQMSELEDKKWNPENSNVPQMLSDVFDLAANTSEIAFLAYLHGQIQESDCHVPINYVAGGQNLQEAFGITPEWIMRTEQGIKTAIDGARSYPDILSRCSALATNKAELICIIDFVCTMKERGIIAEMTTMEFPISNIKGEA